MKDFFARMTPPCREVTRLASESMDRALPLIAKLKIGLHVLICEGCRRYAVQLRAIRDRLRRQPGNDGGTSAPPAPRLSEETKARLYHALKSRQE